MEIDNKLNVTGPSLQRKMSFDILITRTLIQTIKKIRFLDQIVCFMMNSKQSWMTTYPWKRHWFPLGMQGLIPHNSLNNQRDLEEVWFSHELNTLNLCKTETTKQKQYFFSECSINFDESSWMIKKLKTNYKVEESLICRIGFHPLTANNQEKGA